MNTSVYQLENVDIIITMAKILVIDDDINTTWLIDNVFSKEGYEIHTINTSVNALPEALSIKPDLILLDLMMPEIDGIGTCKILQAHGDINSKLEAFKAGARDFITKPVHVEELKSRIRTWINQRES